MITWIREAEVFLQMNWQVEPLFADIRVDVFLHNKPIVVLCNIFVHEPFKSLTMCHLKQGEETHY